MHVRNNVDPPFEVIKDDHRIHKHIDAVGKTVRIVGSHWQTLEISSRFIREIPDRATQEAREPWHVHGAIRGEKRTQRLERVVIWKSLLIALVTRLSDAILEPDDQIGITAEE